MRWMSAIMVNRLGTRASLRIAGSAWTARTKWEASAPARVAAASRWTYHLRAKAVIRLSSKGAMKRVTTGASSVLRSVAEKKPRDARRMDALPWLEGAGSFEYSPASSCTAGTPRGELRPLPNGALSDRFLSKGASSYPTTKGASSYPTIREDNTQRQSGYRANPSNTARRRFVRAA